ncbi:hypothetical protein SMD22_00890 (plasmid) [Brevibacillus halotolerans]|nr:hypothetical protein SMD22_00890 [Brevibacillus halotolerans]
MHYEEMSEAVQDFLSSVHDHLLAIAEHLKESSKPFKIEINAMKEHLQAVLLDLPINITTTKTRGVLCFATEIDNEMVQICLFQKRNIFTNYNITGVVMPLYFHKESWWKHE